MDLGLDGTKVMILGASRGIGRMTAEIFAKEGADLAICARNLEGLEVAKKELLAVGKGSVFSSTADLSDAESLQNFVQTGIQELGGLDILIHNATGVSGQDEEGWRGTFEVDVLGAVRAIEIAQPILEKARTQALHLLAPLRVNSGLEDGPPMGH